MATALEKLCESMSHSVIGKGPQPGGPNNSPLMRSAKQGPNGPILLGVVTQPDLEALVRTLRRLLGNFEILKESDSKEAETAAACRATRLYFFKEPIFIILAAVTRILLLADNVVVKQLLVAGTPGTIDKNLKKSGSSPANPAGSSQSNGSSAVKAVNVIASLSTMHHFNEFVKAFCDFGSDMVHLIRITAGKPHMQR